MYILIICIIAILCALRYNISRELEKSIFNGWKYAEDLRIVATILIPVVMCLGFALCSYPAMRFKNYAWGYQFLLSCFIFYMVFYLFADKIFRKKKKKSNENKATI
jgi:F0F1-type ATP synthase assembly protein I